MAQIIPAPVARGLYTTQLVKIYQQRKQVKKFLKRFFPDAVANTLFIQWAVYREGEPLAVDVLRGTEGKRNTFANETDKQVLPPFYNENFDVTQTDLYYRAWNTDRVDVSLMADWMAWVQRKMQSVTNKIERAQEKQRADFLQTGVITLANGDQIDFKRSPTSTGDLGAGNYFSDEVDPINSFFAPGIKFLKTVGKAEGGNYNCIFGENSLNGFLNNTFVKTRGRDFYMKLTDLQMPKMDSDGAAYHGRISADTYTVDLWSYPESYDTTLPPTVDTSRTYIDANQAILLPENPDWSMAYGAVPMLPKGGTGMISGVPTVTPGAFVPYDYMDMRNTTWISGVKSAGIVLPAAVDLAYNKKVMPSA